MNRHFEMLETNGIRLRTVVEGNGPLVVLLHGWPQCWYLWRHQIDPLVAAGYRVAVPDLRGYGGSSKPGAVTDYDIRTLAADVAGIAGALGEETFQLIGHDWGCIVAWNTALLHEDIVSAVMGLSVPFWRLGPASIDPPAWTINSGIYGIFRKATARTQILNRTWHRVCMPSITALRPTPHMVVS